MTCHSDTPTPASMEAARAIRIPCEYCGGSGNGARAERCTHCANGGVGLNGRITPAVARALDAAEARGWRKGMEDAAGIHETHSPANTNRGIEIIPTKVRTCETMKAWAAFFRSRISERGEGGANG